jgi:hypothetical protein
VDEEDEVWWVRWGEGPRTPGSSQLDEDRLTERTQ